jgi:hypothetical protein
MRWYINSILHMLVQLIRLGLRRWAAWSWCVWCMYAFLPSRWTYRRSLFNAQSCFVICRRSSCLMENRVEHTTSWFPIIYVVRSCCGFTVTDRWYRLTRLQAALRLHLCLPIYLCNIWWSVLFIIHQSTDKHCLTARAGPLYELVGYTISPCSDLVYGVAYISCLSNRSLSSPTILWSHHNGATEWRWIGQRMLSLTHIFEWMSTN